MISSKVHKSVISKFIVEKLKNYLALAKYKLTLIVVITSVLGYLYAGGNMISWPFIVLFIAGFLVSGSANSINQILEQKYDAVMKRTMDRPLPAKRISDSEAWLFAGISGLTGTLLLWAFFGQTTALLGLISIITYAFVYTPLKRIHPIAVFVGAFPGALPPLIGYIAASGIINIDAVLLFLVQFLWQFPHFWAIAWLAFDDYKKAGYRLLPTGRKDDSVPIQSIFFILILIGVTIAAFVLNYASLTATIICIAASIAYLVPAIKLYGSKSNEDARALMFVSFAYLPIVFTALIIF